MAGCSYKPESPCAKNLVGLLDRRLWDNFRRLSAGMHDKPAVDELVRWVSDHLLITNIWIARVISFFRKPLERSATDATLEFRH